MSIPYMIVERFADDGSHSYWELVNEHGIVLWSDEGGDYCLYGEYGKMLDHLEESVEVMTDQIKRLKPLECKKRCK